ncbi:hypothetical protein QJS04_geneDACA010517 [Acorus gramineus]|uniref:F-box protein At3g26010-like beta-propeller domain-containing protein n=1 Tax=Acorus gramineus TaxID=55184 RepID=A0AAV9AK79_ACOGR|nr:hypothetical protein QJS04_geneDACA010517 [Acorus gramineus]
MSNTWRRNVSKIILKKPPELMSSGLLYEYKAPKVSVTRYALLPTSNHGDEAITMNVNNLSTMEIYNCSHGLILCSNHYWSEKYRIINPLTTRKTSLPRSPHPSIDSFCATLIVDPDDLSYRVVLLITKYNYALVGIDVFSSKTGRWEESELTIVEGLFYFLIYKDEQAYFLKGALHVLVRKNDQGVLFIYDMGEKTARVIELPCEVSCYQCLGVSQGRLHLAAHDFVGGDEYQHLIWVLEEEDQWVLKHRLGPLGPLDHHLLAFHPDLDVIFFYRTRTKKDVHKILMYDLTNMEIKDVCTFHHRFNVRVNCIPISPTLVNPRKLVV